MKTFLCGLVVVFLVSPVLADKTVVGSGVTVNVTRELPEFDRIELRIAADVRVAIGKTAPLVISGDDNIVPLIKTEVKDGRLIISLEDGQSFKTKNDPDITVMLANLAGLTVLGAGDFRVDGLDNESLEVSMSGAGDLRISGKTGRLVIDINGAADVFAFELEADQALVSIKGAGDVKINASKSLNVSIVGAGDVRYKGDPTVIQSVVGNGDVKRVK